MTTPTPTHYAIGWYKDLDGTVQEMDGVIDPVTGVVTFPCAPTRGMMIIPYPDAPPEIEG